MAQTQLSCQTHLLFPHLWISWHFEQPPQKWAKEEVLFLDQWHTFLVVVGTSYFLGCLDHRIPWHHLLDFVGFYWWLHQTDPAYKLCHWAQRWLLTGSIMPPVAIWASSNLMAWSSPMRPFFIAQRGRSCLCVWILVASDSSLRRQHLVVEFRSN